jgi:SM-20-related protein
MPRFGFFTHLSLMGVKDILEAELCARLRAEMCLLSGSPAMVGGAATGTVDEDVRRASCVEVSSQTKSLIKERLSDLRPRLESHFKIALKGFEKPQFLVYREGCFYTPHRDRSDDPEALEYFKERKVSVVIFLNDESEEPAEEFYSGGQLTFYGLMKDPLWKHCGLPLIGERGLLIAFRSDVMHEVKAVTRGVRYTIATWFF